MSVFGFREDLLLHFFVSFFIEVMIGATLMYAELNQWLSIFIAIFITAGIGLFKEFIYDKKLGKGIFDVTDMLADLLGIVIGLIPLAL